MNRMKIGPIWPHKSRFGALKLAVVLATWPVDNAVEIQLALDGFSNRYVADPKEGMKLGPTYMFFYDISFLH